MHPAHQAFQKWLEGKSLAYIGQIWIGAGDRFELRHQQDEATSAEKLVTYTDPFAARELATNTDDGKFRPLKSAPNLRRGWRIDGLDFAGMITAIDCFYPAGIVHWHSREMGRLDITSYRMFAARQTGMYRITTKLSDEQVQQVSACCCDDRECLKKPLWPIDEKTKLELAEPAASGKNRLLMPCPEPCSLFLSFARKVVRLEQEDLMDVKFTKSDLALIGRVLRSVLDGEQADYREGDYDDPRHRQRIQYFLKKYEHLFSVPDASSEQEEG